VTAEPTPGDAESGTLAEFVGGLVERYELWTRIPRCWQDHPQVTHEMQALWDFWESTEKAAAEDPLRAALGRANWHDYLARALARLAEGPDATCAKARIHRVPQTWDDDEFLARKAAQRAR
jgi:hypothetical protein